VDAEQYWSRLERQKPDCQVVLGTKSFYKNKDELSGCCEIGQQVRQVCPLSPILFNIYIQHVINEGLADIQEAVKGGGVLVQSIHFAGDQAMVFHTQCGLQRIMDAIQQTANKCEKNHSYTNAREEGQEVENNGQW